MDTVWWWLTIAVLLAPVAGVAIWCREGLLRLQRSIRKRANPAR